MQTPAVPSMTSEGGWRGGGTLFCVRAFGFVCGWWCLWVLGVALGFLCFIITIIRLVVKNVFTIDFGFAKVIILLL